VARAGGLNHSGWRLSPEFQLDIHVWPDGGIAFSRTSGDTHWVPESACLVLEALQDSPLSRNQLQQKLARRLEMAEDDAILCQILDAACEALIKSALIEPIIPIES
jgi:PqqD family protein of HPr-rel-A system